MRPLPILLVFVLSLAVVLLFNEFLIYFVVLYQCRWPEKINDPIRAILIADTHLLGPWRGHWFDKLRREWQMHRSFQTTMTIFDPDVVFILGDVFDEGDIVDQKDFRRYVKRFHRLFEPPPGVPLYSIIGNHDAGFHYRLHPQLIDRFDKSFNKTSNSIITIKGVHFIMINSMTMEQDGCGFCLKAENDVKSIAKRLRCAKDNKRAECSYVSKPLESYSQPILLQHFPTYRETDEMCIEHDSPKIETYREGWEVVSKVATKFLGSQLNPRIAFSGHSHHYCHSINTLGIEEYTIASFSWRNKINPSFLLAEFSANEHSIYKCDMPNEYFVLAIYSIYSFLVILCPIIFLCRCCRRKLKRF